MWVLSVLPELLSYAMVVPLFLRLALAVFLFSEARQFFHARPVRGEADGSLPRRRWEGLIELGLALFLLPALFTQAAALLAAVLLGALGYFPAMRARFGARHESLVYFFAAIMALALVFLGPGAVAIDLPL